MMTRTRAAFALCLLVYLAFSLYQLDLPGLHYDEAFEAVPAVQLLRGQPVTAFRNSGLFIGGRLYPLMTQDYIGALNTYAAIPFILLLGPTPTALRLMSVLVGAAGLWLAYLLARDLAQSRTAGLLAAALLCTDPSFIFWNRQGVFVTAVTAPIGLAAALCWLRWVRHRRFRWAAGGMFFFGLGLYAKFLFLWLIAALASAAVLVNLPGLLQPDKRRALLAGWQTLFTPARAGLLGLSFLLGSWPLLVYNLQTGGTIKNITQNAGVSYYGVNNLAILPNLWERLQQFIILLNGGHLWYLGEVVSNTWPPLVFGGILLLTVFTSTRKHSGSPGLQSTLFPFIVPGLVVLFSVATVSALWVTHYAILMPWPAVAVSAAGWRLVRQARRPEPARLLLALAVGLVVLTNGVSGWRYHRSLAVSGGLSTHSDAIYKLSQWLGQNAAGTVVAMDWGLSAPVTYLTGGQVTPVEIFGYDWQPRQTLVDQLQPFVHQPETLYLWRAPDEIIFDRSAEFKALYRPLGLEEDIAAAFYERSGRPLLGVTRLVPKGQAVNPPK